MSKLYIISSVLIILIFCSAFMQQQPKLSGKEIFEKNCVRCHGTEGTKHFLGAKDLQKSKMDDTAIILIIQNGKGFMPSYSKRLTTVEINNLVMYVKSLRK